MMIVKHRVAIGVVAIVLAVVIALMIVEIILNGTGFAGRTLWDWLQLLAAFAIPVVVGFGAVWFTTRQGKVTDAANTDNQREAALQAYLDKMSELLLHEHLRGSKPEDEIRQIGQARTLTVLPRLDGGRKRSVLQFLYEANLINIFDWSSANLSEAALNEAKLRGTNLSGANLDRADLRDTQLSQAFLIGVNLRGADLNGARCSGAKFSGADLTGVDLADADLSGANFRKAKLSGADLSGANLDRADLSNAKLSKTMNWYALSTIQRRRIRQIFDGDHVRERVLHTWMSVGRLNLLLGGLNLHVAFKNGTKLSGANLNRANLSFADLRDTNLERANLKEADLGKADLTRTNLKEANLTKATMSKVTRFIGVIRWRKYYPIWGWGVDYPSWADMEEVSPYPIEVQRLSTTEAINLLTKAKNRLEKSDRNKILLLVVHLKPARLTVVRLKVEAADLTGADLTGADLSGTNLRKAIITHEQLGKAKLLEGAIMPDGSIHP